MAAYTTITGEVLADIRVIDGKIYNLADYKNNNRVSNGELTLTNLGSDSKISNPTITIKSPNPKNSSNGNISIWKTKNSILLGNTFTLTFWARETALNTDSTHNAVGAAVSTTNTDFGFIEGINSTQFSIHADYSNAIGWREWFHIMNYINEERKDPLTQNGGAIANNSSFCTNQWCYYTLMVENGTTYRCYRNGTKITERTSTYTTWKKFNRIVLEAPGVTNMNAYYDDIILINQLIFPVNGFTPPTDYVTGPYTGTLHNRMRLSPYQTIYDDRTILY